MAITRVVPTDDDGTGTTGTVLNAAYLTSIYDSIENEYTPAAATTTSTGNQDNFSFSSADLLRCNNASALTLRGLAAGVSGQQLTIVSVGAGTVTLNDQDTNSTAANRIITGNSAAIALPAGIGRATLVYDGTTQRWRVIDYTLSPRVVSTASSATPTPNADITDLYDITALAANATFGAPTGAPVNGQKLMIRIKDNGTARTLAWNAAYVEGGAALPTTTTLSKILYVLLVYNTANALNKWQCVYTALEGASVGQMTLLLATSGTDATAAATNVATVAISGLTAKDRIFISYTMESITQTTANPRFYNNTDAVVLAQVNGQNNLTVANGLLVGQCWLQQAQSAATRVTGWDFGTPIGSGPTGIVASGHDAIVTTNWTGSWTLALRTGTGGVTAGGTFRYSLAAWLVKGQ